MEVRHRKRATFAGGEGQVGVLEYVEQNQQSAFFSFSFISGVLDRSMW
jgi:hypothetical protein